MASNDFKKIGGLWKSELAGKKVLQGMIDLDLRGLELSQKSHAPSVRVTIWPNVDKKNPAAPDYTMSAKISGGVPAGDADRRGPKPTASPPGFFDDEEAAPARHREPGEDDLPF